MTVGQGPNDAAGTVLEALRAVAASSHDGVVLLGRDAVVRYANDVARRHLEFADDLQGAPLRSILRMLPAGAVSWSGAVDVGRGRPPLDVSAWVVGPGESDAVVVATFSARTGDHPDPTPHEDQLSDALTAVRRRAHEQRVIARLNRAALTGSFDDLVETTLRSVVDLLEATCAVLLRVEGDDHLSVYAAEPRPVGPEHATTERRLTSTSLSGHALRTGDLAVCVDAATETRFDASTLTGLGVSSGIAAPVRGDGGAWGVLSVYRADPYTPTADTVSFVATVAAVVSSAVRRSDLERELRYRSLHDPLTRLANRTLAYRRIDAALETSREDGTLTAVILVDLDDFRTVNDIHGHAVGDAVLTAVAPVLTRAVRPTDTVARFGGDEFLLVCPGLRSAFDAQTIAQTVLESFRRPLVVGDRTMDVTVCLGVSVGFGEKTASQMVRHADVAMGGAKREGPAGYELYDKVQGGEASRRLAIATELRSAIDNDELDVAYQPVFDIRSDKLTGVEALARWTTSSLGVVGPDEFVPAAERSGLIGPLGTRILRRACAEAARWQTGDPIELRVNVSPLQLRNRTFASSLAHTLHETGFAPELLGIEITETVWLEDTSAVKNNLDALHRMGIKILLDDFGVGHSSLDYLMRFPILDSIKIDRSFVADLPTEQSEAVIRAVVSVADAFGLDVVGEGVENRSQLQSLRRCGCRYAQGYLLARPMPPAEIDTLVSAGGLLGGDRPDAS